MAEDGSSKIEFTGYSDKAKSTQLDSISFPSKPDNISFSYKTSLKDGQDTGSYSGSTSFTIQLDGTGVLYRTSSTVVEQVNKLKGILIAFDTTGLNQSFVEVKWGTVFGGLGIRGDSNSTSNAFFGKVSSMNINYTLFTPDGTPLRAKVDISIDQWLDELSSSGSSSTIDMTALTKPELKDTFISKLKTELAKEKSSRSSNQETKVGTRNEN